MGEARRKKLLGIGRTVTFCPATMCPLFAAEGSPWTGEKNGECPRRHTSTPGTRGCLWYRGFGGCGCDGRTAALGQVAEAEAGKRVLQIGPVIAEKERVAAKTFDCPRAHECQWQAESKGELCPPRLALAKGIDPRTCAY